MLEQFYGGGGYTVPSDRRCGKKGRLKPEINITCWEINPGVKAGYVFLSYLTKQPSKQPSGSEDTPLDRYSSIAFLEQIVPVWAASIPSLHVQLPLAAIHVIKTTADTV